MISSPQFAECLNDQIEAIWYDPLVWAFSEFEILAPIEQAAFLAQAIHESVAFTHLEENLNYSAKRITQVWPVRFTLSQAALYANKPEALANKVYANRMGNRDEISGDGYLYRGRGIFMLTGSNNYNTYSHLVGRPLHLHPELLLDPATSTRVACAYWKFNKLSQYALTEDLDSICDIVNIGRRTPAQGDAVGYPERLAHYLRIKKILGI